MRWLPAQDDLLVQMHRRGFSKERIAQRFDCTIQDIDARLDMLQMRPLPPDAPPQESGALASPEEVEAMKKAMNPLQRAFIDHCQHYNSMGETMKAIAEACERCLQPEELEKILLDCFEEPRQPGETIQQKLARTLLGRCIVISCLPRDEQRTTPEGVHKT